MAELYNNKTTHIWNKYVSLIKNQPDIMFDVGPGYINSEAWGCKERWPSCKIIGAEPNDSRYNALKETFPGTLIKTAIGKNCDNLKGYLGIPQYPDTTNNSDFRIAITHEEKQRGVYAESEVPCTTIDELYKEHGPAKHVIIWADIEGAELDMLIGAEKTIESGCVQAISLEIVNRPKLNLPTMDDIKRYLQGFGYQIIRAASTDYIFIPRSLL